MWAMIIKIYSHTNLKLEKGDIAPDLNFTGLIGPKKLLGWKRSSRKTSMGHLMVKPVMFNSNNTNNPKWQIKCDQI